MDSPGGPVVKNTSANAGDMGSTPALGSFHMLWTTTESECLEPVLCEREATARRSLHPKTKSSPHSAQLEKVCTQ